MRRLQQCNGANTKITEVLRLYIFRLDLFESITIVKKHAGNRFIYIENIKAVRGYS